MKITSFLVSLAATAAAAPHAAEEHGMAGRRDVAPNYACTPTGIVEMHRYNVHNEIRSSSAGLGSQCSWVNGNFNDVIRWTSAWTWGGDVSVLKSFPSARLRNFRSTLIGWHSSLPTSWQWSYTGTDTVATVAYAMKGSRGGLDGRCATLTEWTVEVWLGNLGGTAPPSRTGSPIATATISDVAFDVYLSTTGGRVFTFVATSTQASFTGDLLLFLHWLVENQGQAPNMCIQEIVAGTKTYSGTQSKFEATSFRLGQELSSGVPPEPTTTTTSGPVPTQSPCVPVWAQCGGQGYTGPTCCEAGSSCFWYHEWESQCLPA